MIKSLAALTLVLGFGFSASAQMFPPPPGAAESYSSDFYCSYSTEEENLVCGSQSYYSSCSSELVDSAFILLNENDGRPLRELLAYEWGGNYDHAAQVVDSLSGYANVFTGGNPLSEGTFLELTGCKFGKDYFETSLQLRRISTNLLCLQYGRCRR